MTTTTTRPSATKGGTAHPPGRQRSVVLAAVVAVAAIAVLFVVYNRAGSQGDAATGGSVSYDIGSPATGAAPALGLPTTSGSTLDLADYRGKSILLYFQEGLMCQACWTQLKDLEAAQADLAAAGVDELVNITTDPVDLLAQKVRDDGFTTTTAADVDGSASQRYGTLGIGMMGGDMNGHSFVLVGPDGQIQWRADYGGAPDYTMYVPVDQILADLEKGRTAA